MQYSQFCLVVLKQEGLKPGSDFTEISNKLYLKGQLMDTSLLGNIHAYLPQYKNLSRTELAKIFKENLMKAPAFFLKDFVADFSFVHFMDTNIIAARDHMGVFPLYYYNDENILVIANDQRLMITLPGLNLTPDATWAGNFIVSDKKLWSNTFYQYIKKVPPAHFLKYQEGKLELERYWDLHIHKKHPLKSDEEYISEFKDLLQEAIESRMPDDVNIGSEVSGGIDCTSIAAIAKAYLDKNKRPLYTYAHGAFDDKKFPSEKGAIEKYLTHLQPYKHTFSPQKLIGMRSIAEHAFALRNGVPNSHYALFSKEIYENAAKDNVKIVFSGNGGDHCVSYKGYQPILRYYFFNGQWKRVFYELRLLHKKPVRLITAFIKFFISNPFENKPERENNHRKKEIIRKFTTLFPALKDYQYQKRERLSKKLSPEQRIYSKLMEPHIAERLEATTISASHFDVLYRYPLLDIRLMQYFFSLPFHMMYRNNQNRYIFRESIKHWVPTYLAYQLKPPGNMYGWILEAYKFDFENNKQYSIQPQDEEIRLYYEYWKYRDEQCYKENGNFEEGKINPKLIIK